MSLADRLVAAVALVSVVAPVFCAEEPRTSAAFVLMAVGVDRPHDRVAELYGVSPDAASAESATVWKFRPNPRSMRLKNCTSHWHTVVQLHGGLPGRR